MNSFERKLELRKANQQRYADKRLFTKILKRKALEDFYEEAFVLKFGKQPEHDVTKMHVKTLKSFGDKVFAEFHERELGGLDET